MSKFKKTDSDRILSDVQSGNEKPEAIISHYRGLVESVAKKYISSPMEQDDIIQEGMIGLLAAIKTFDEGKGASFKTYAYTCIDNSIQTALRKYNRLKDIPQNSMVEYLEDEIPQNQGTISAEDYVIAQESVSLLTELLKENLSDFENEVLRLHIVGCSYNEIAVRLSKTPKAVDNAIQRIRRKLSAISF